MGTCPGSRNWDERFLFPYESLWGLKHKISFMEGYNVGQISTKDGSHTRQPKIFLNWDEHESYQRIRYCPVCATYGYHSILHQLICLDNCFVHPEQKLIDVEYPSSGKIEKSFYEHLGTRAIDIIDNNLFRNEVESSVDFDQIQIIDITNNLFPKWHQSTLTTTRECILKKSFSNARKIAELTLDADESIITELVDSYLADESIPLMVDRRDGWIPGYSRDLFEKYLRDNVENLKMTWKGKIRYNKNSVLHLRFHKEYAHICSQIGDVKQFDEILSAIHFGSIDLSLCNYNTYAKIICLILSTELCSSGNFECLLSEPLSISEIPCRKNALQFIFNDLDQCIKIKETCNIQDVSVSVLSAIITDVFSHTAAVLTELMEGERMPAGGSEKHIYGSHFKLPVSQYVAIWRLGKVELWACDPKIDNFLHNIATLKVLEVDRTVKRTIMFNSSETLPL